MSLLLELNKQPEFLKRLSRPLDEAIFTVAVLKKTMCADISSLPTRIVCQKVIYFANRLGLSPKYNFNLYVYGPYSTDLANDLFVLSEKFDRIIPSDFISDEAKIIIEKLNNPLVSVKKDPRYLELAATLDFFNVNLASKEKAISATKRIKVASEEELKTAEKILVELGLW